VYIAKPRRYPVGIAPRSPSARVQQAVSYLCVMFSLEEATKAFSPLSSLLMLVWQACSLMRPVARHWRLGSKSGCRCYERREPSRRRSARLIHLRKASTGSTSSWIVCQCTYNGVLCQPSSSTPGMCAARSMWGQFSCEKGAWLSELVPEICVDEPVEGRMHYLAQRTAFGNFGFCSKNLWCITACVAPSRSLSLEKECIGSDGRSNNSFPSRCRSLISHNPKNKSGRSLMPSLAAPCQREWPEPSMDAAGSSRERSNPRARHCYIVVNRVFPRPAQEPPGTSHWLL
jgi:hypothetical protein